MSKPALVFGTLVVAVLLFAAGWAVKGGRDRAAVTAAKASADQAVQAAAVAHQRVLDSLRNAQAASAAQWTQDSLELARLRRLAAGHAAADQALGAALAAAQTDAQRVPILTEQRDQARLAYQLERRAGLDAEELFRDRMRDLAGAAEIRRLADSSLAASREAALRAENARLAQELLDHGESKKLLGFIPAPRCGPGVGVTVGAGATRGVAGGGKLGASAAAGVTVACIIPL